MQEKPSKRSSLHTNEESNNVYDFIQNKIKDEDFSAFDPSELQSDDPKIQQELARKYEFSTLVAPFISRNEITAGALYKLRCVGIEIAAAALFFDVTIAELESRLKENAALRQAWDGGLGVFKVVLLRNLVQQSKSNSTILMELCNRHLPQDTGEEKELQKKARENMFDCIDFLTTMMMEKKGKEVEKGADGTFVLPDNKNEPEKS